MRFFSKKTEKKTYDPSSQKPIIKDIHTGKFEEVMLIRKAEDLEAFKTMYGIEGEIAKKY